MTGDRRLLKLAVGNVLLGIAAALLARVQLSDPFGLSSILPPFGLSHIFLVPLIASVLCQAVLLALWGTSSSLSPWARLAGLAAGAAYLEALFPDTMMHELFGISTITIAVTTATLLVVRALGVRLIRRDDTGRHARAEAEGLRFSIRDLMLFTAAVALLSAGARAFRETPHRVVLLIAVWALCFVAAGLTALWAALGSARPLRRGLIVFALSPVLGGFFAFAAIAHRAGWVYIILTMLLYPALLLGSLLVVRSCDYRLVRRAGPSSGPSDGGGGLSSFHPPASGATTSV